MMFWNRKRKSNPAHATLDLDPARTVAADCLGATVVDCEVTLLDRILAGEAVWEGDESAVTPAHAAHIRSAVALAEYGRTGKTPARVA